MLGFDLDFLLYYKITRTDAVWHNEAIAAYRLQLAVKPKNQSSASNGQDLFLRKGK